MSNNNIDLTTVMAVDGGLRYILHKYPNAVGCENQRNKKFKLRDSEKTASASLKQWPDGKWGVTDFGGDGKMMDAIRIAMLEDGLEFRDAVNTVAAFYDIAGAKEEAARPAYNEWPAKPDEQEGLTTYGTKELTEAEIKTVLTTAAWQALHKDEDKRLANAKTLFALYHIKSVEWKRFTSKGKTMEFRSNERYPMFIYEEGTEKERWGRFYEPKAEKKFRFFYTGTKPKVFIHGQSQAFKKHADMNAQADAEYEKLSDEEKKTARKKITKLDAIIQCSGGSDALNVAALGYTVVWRNSESEPWTYDQYQALKKITDNFYNLPDIDSTGIEKGHEMALKFLDMRTIWLPERMQEKRDLKGNPINKDLRDFLNYQRNDKNQGTYGKSDFENLVNTALPYEFWDADPKLDKNGAAKMKNGRKVMEYKPNNERIYNFLYRMGYCRLKSDKVKEGFVYAHVQNNIVREIEPTEMEDFVRSFLRGRYFTEDLLNAFNRSPQVNTSSLSKIDYRVLDFKAFTADYQYLFFNNTTWKVTANSIEELAPGATGKCVWEDKILKLESIVNGQPREYKAKKEEPMFKPTQLADGSWTVNVLRDDCLYLNFLIQTCRVHWREELEERLEFFENYETAEKQEIYRLNAGLGAEQMAAIARHAKNAETQEAYRAANKVQIAGELLTDEEKAEQMAHLANRLYVMGYALHRWKFSSRPWAVWTMDAKLSEEGESHGGSGKSLVTRALKTLLRVVPLPGRNEKMTENAFMLENVTEDTDLVLVDDTHQHMDFGPFFEPTTSDMVINRKNVKSIVVPFRKSPKFWFNSNYGDKHNDPSSRRRKIYSVFSDYYHKNASGTYREDRNPKDDFGIDLFDDFDEKQWNLFYNLMAQCIQFYLSCENAVEAPAENVEKRSLMAVMGDNFRAWADVYFSMESRRLDIDTARDDAQDNFFKITKMTPQSFLKKLRAWCKFYGYVLNPVDRCGKDKKRIIAQLDGVSKEMFYIDTSGITMLKGTAAAAAMASDEMPF